MKDDDLPIEYSGPEPLTLGDWLWLTLVFALIALFFFDVFAPIF